MNKVIAAALLSVFFLALTAPAEMYRWEDDKGVVTFKDTPPPVSKKRSKVKVYTDSDFDPAPPPPPPTQRRGKASTKAAVQPQPAPAQQRRFTGTVEIYVTDWCGYCRQAESYMSTRGIPFVAYDIEKDRSANRRHKELGGGGVPLIIIGSNRMSGFSAENLEFYLNNP